MANLCSLLIVRFNRCLMFQRVRVHDVKHYWTRQKFDRILVHFYHYWRHMCSPKASKVWNAQGHRGQREPLQTVTGRTVALDKVATLLGPHRANNRLSSQTNLWTVSSVQFTSYVFFGLMEEVRWTREKPEARNQSVFETIQVWLCD